MEIWPTSLVVPAGYTPELLFEGKDFERPASEQDPAYARQVEQMNAFTDEADWSALYRGCGLFLHNDPVDRPTEVFGGMNTIYGGGRFDSYLLLPVIPPH